MREYYRFNSCLTYIKEEAPFAKSKVEERGSSKHVQGMEVRIAYEAGTHENIPA